MLTLHHLNDSRSQRILWLMEELGMPYDLKRYQRDAKTRLAPVELEAVHPLGKSPVIVDGDTRIAESGAIVDYIIRRYGKGSMMPAPGSADYEAYNEWLHYSEGSAMLPLMMHPMSRGWAMPASRCTRASTARWRGISAMSTARWRGASFSLARR
jgi:glutathione S-transferase